MGKVFGTFSIFLIALAMAFSVTGAAAQEAPTVYAVDNLDTIFPSCENQGLCAFDFAEYPINISIPYSCGGEDQILSLTLMGGMAVIQEWSYDGGSRKAITIFNH